MSETEILIENRDGLPIRADLHLPEGVARPPLVLVAHGFKGFKDWGFFPWLARRLAEGGLAALRFDFARNGVGEDKSTFERLDLFEENSLSRELADLEDLVRNIGAVPQCSTVDVARLGLFGHSRGGGVAVVFAAREPRVRSLVTWAAVAVFARYFTPEILEQWRSDGVIHVENARTKQMMPLGLELLDDLTVRSAELDVVAAERALGRPHLIVHGDADETVPVEDAHTLLDAAGDGARTAIIEGGGHTFGAVHPFEGETPELTAAIEATVAHFRETL